MPGENDAFRRTAVRLLALAVLAERAGGRARPLCCFVLWLLRPAESVAHAYLAEVALLVPAFSPVSGDDRDDAMRLGERFRALAAAFFALAEQAAPPSREAPTLPSDGAGRLPRPDTHRHPSSVVAPHSRAPPAFRALPS